MAHKEGVGRLGAAGGGGGVSCAALLGPEVVNETAHLNGCGLVGVACVAGWLVGWLVGWSCAGVCLRSCVPSFVCAFVSLRCVFSFRGLFVCVLSWVEICRVCT